MKAQPAVCGARRSGDGAVCELEYQHYGEHVWPEIQLPIVRVGDRIWFTVQLLGELAKETNPVLVRVANIAHHADGTVQLVLDRDRQRISYCDVGSDVPNGGAA